jgi:hypothetical protein
LTTALHNRRALREQIDGLLRKWLARLPHPFTAADRAAGYRYDLSILQAEFSLTQVLASRAWGASCAKTSCAKTWTWAVQTRCNSSLRAV